MHIAYSTYRAIGLSLSFTSPLCVGREEFSGIIDERYLSPWSFRG